MSYTVISRDLINDEVKTGLQSLWEDSLLVDFTLKVEKEEFQVHKVILASCSGYFRAMFTGGMRESRQKSLNLTGFKASAVKSLISFIYKRSIELSNETVEDILAAAHYLQLASAVEKCTNYILDNLTWENCSNVKQLGKLYSLDVLERGVVQFMCGISWEYLPQKPEILKAVGKEYVEQAGSDSLFVMSEYSLFEKLLNFKPYLSEDEFYEALSKVRYPLMSKDELEEVSKTGLMKPRLSHLMEEALEYHKDVRRQPLLQTERTQVRSDKITMVLATVDSIHGICEAEARFMKESEQPGFQQIESVDNFLYLCETCDDYTGLFRFDPRFQHQDWIEMAPLLNKDRYCFPFVAYQNQLFAIGGKDTRTVEVYDIQTNKWRYCADINYDNRCSSGVLLGDKIYVCGGVNYSGIQEEEMVEEDMSDNDEQYVKTLSCYDPAEDTWKLKAPMLEERYLHQIAVVGGRVYVFGGVAKGVLHSVEHYNPKTNQWTSLKRKLRNKLEGLCPSGSDIYLLTMIKGLMPSSVRVYSEKFDPNDETSPCEFTCFVPYTTGDNDDIAPVYSCAPLCFPPR